VGGYFPNPLAVEALKGAAYSTLGWGVRTRSERQRSVVVFGLARVALGWPVGAAAVVIAAAVPSSWNGGFILLYAALTVPRCGIWFFLIERYFRPHGGSRAVTRWALAGVILSMVTDLIAFGLFTNVAALRIGWC
jgi:hypothetical protein